MDNSGKSWHISERKLLYEYWYIDFDDDTSIPDFLVLSYEVLELWRKIGS